MGAVSWELGGCGSFNFSRLTFIIPQQRFLSLKSIIAIELYLEREHMRRAALPARAKYRCYVKLLSQLAARCHIK